MPISYEPIMKQPNSQDLSVLPETLVKAFDEFGLGVAILDPTTRRLTYVNSAVSRITGYGASELLSFPTFFSLVISDYQSLLNEWTRSLGVDVLSPAKEMTLLHQSGSRVFVEISAKKFPQKKGAYSYLLLMRDITPKKQVQDQLHLFQTITLAVNEARDFSTALGMAIRRVCISTGWEYGEVWVPAPDSSRLILSEASFSSAHSYDALRKARMNLTYEWGQGLPGKAWADGQPQWSEDIEQEREERDKSPKWQFGLQTGMAIPAITKGGVAAVMVFYVSKKHINKDLYIGIASVVAPQLGSLFQRKKAEMDRDRFFTVSPDMLCIAGFDGYFKQLSPAWEKILGFSTEELMQKPFIDWIHPDDKEKTIQESKRVMKGGAPRPFENRYLCKDGRYKWLLWNATSYPEEQRFYAVARDIGARLKREEEMKRLNTFLDSIVENIPDMVFIKDAADLRFIRFNKAGEELLGISREKMIGKSDYDFFPKEEADFFTAKDRMVLENGQLVDIPQEPIHTQKGIRILHTKKIPILDEKGKPIYLLGISEDITEKIKK